MFRLAVESVSRRTGRSAPAAAAYRTGLLLVNQRTGRTHDFRRRSGVEEDGIFILYPIGCEWAGNRSDLWNKVEARENRKDAKVAREIVAALPYGLNRAQRRALCHKFGRYIVNQYGVAVDVAMHEPGKHGDQRNFHCHFLMTTRVVEPDGVLAAKTRQLDVSTSASVEVENLRAAWEGLANEALEQAGSIERVSRLSHARRGDGLLPQITLGVAASAMERRGYPTEIGRRNREIAAHNTDITAHQAEVAGFQAALKRVERRHGSGRDAGPPRTATTPRPVRPFHESGRNAENAVSVGQIMPSFRERRAGSDRRMAAARAKLGTVAELPLSPSNAIARTRAKSEVRDEPQNGGAIVPSIEPGLLRGPETAGRAAQQLPRDRKALAASVATIFRAGSDVAATTTTLTPADDKLLAAATAAIAAQPSVSDAPLPESKTPALAETPVVARAPTSKPAEDIAKDFGAIVREQLAAEGETFTKWAALWSRHASRGDKSARDATRKAWEKTTELHKVAQAIGTIVQWAKSNTVEATDWALSVAKLPKTEVAKLRHELQAPAEKPKGGHSK